MDKIEETFGKIDLNIDNYSITDLENFLGFKDKKYNHDAIENRIYEIREKMLNSGDVQQYFKRDFIEFLDKVNQTLKNNRQVKNPTTVPKNAILDETQQPISAELPTSRAPNVIERPVTNYMYAQNSEYFEGMMNPLRKRSVCKYITVDTRFRDNYYTTSSSDFSVKLPSKIGKVVELQLTGLEIPKDFYSISKQYCNNYFHISIFFKNDGSGVESSRVFVIPDGNYTSEGLISKINEVVSPKYNNGSLKNVNDIFSYICFELLTGEDGSGSNKVSIKVNPNYSNIVSQIDEIRLDFATDIEGNSDNRYIATKFGWNLGFIKDNYLGYTTYIGEKPIESNAIKYLYLAVDDFNNSVNATFTTAFEKNGLKPNILARISMDGKGKENVIINEDYKVITEPRTYFGPVDIQRLHVSIFDDQGRIINMNHSDYSFCLKLTIMYDL